MNAKARKKLDEFIARVNTLYSEVGSWLENEPFSTRKETIEINEKLAGKYEIESLTISDNEGILIAELRPIGAWIIAAEGRVDIIGKSDNENLVYIVSDGPHVTMQEKTENQKIQRSSRPIFKGIEGSGWYWIESKRLGRARLLDKNLFIDLMSVVSDYELI